jgi:hypothetical protein
VAMNSNSFLWPLMRRAVEAVFTITFTNLVLFTAGERKGVTSQLLQSR